MSDNAPLILIVDDEIHILHVLRLKLANAGFRVLTAEDGREALGVALEHSPALIITDFHMPNMTGIELLKQLRAHAQTREIPCLMLTARGFSLSAQQMEETNIIAVVTKPFSPREILSRVQEVVGIKGDMQEVQSPT